MQDHFREALERLDIPLLRKMWTHAKPHLAQAENDEQALIVAHMTRTKMPNMGFRHRAYSHAWLIERSLPSQLPDGLRPRAERMYPQPIFGVGLAVRNATPVAFAIRGAMEGAVLDAGVKDSALTKRAIMSARAKARKQLLGITE
jgi:hypothetical protein